MGRVMGALERVPVRWRIAITTAGMTLVILVVFALVLGNVVGDRIRDDFDDELRSAAAALAAETTVASDPVLGPVVSSPRLADSAMTDDAVIRVVDGTGQPLATSNRSVSLPPPRAEIMNAGEFSVATAPITNANSLPAFIQYAEPDGKIEDSVGRLWLFLGVGVVGGSLLALLAGLAVADRAMRPISSLTAQARDIATTRDPSKRMPVPAADDEVGELARTMDGMLASLDDARNERERALERQREFIADASHELRTPLTSVQANLELLQASFSDPEDRHAVDSALGSTRRMSRLVSDLLLLARADAGRRSARTRTDLAAVARDALDEVRPLLGERKLELELDGPLEIEGNPDELHRLVLNLLENAMRHTPEGTTVSLNVRREDDHAALVVADDGPGIPRALGEQVFQRFVHGEGRADTAGGQGSGLGLAIVRAVAESHGGSVAAGRSRLGGAEFSVRIPLIHVQERYVDSDADETQPAEAGTPLARRAPR